VSKYPGSAEASQAQFLIGHLLETELDKLSQALEQYRKVTGPYQPTAVQAAAQLTAKTMTIASERVFRTNETPKIKLDTRNVDSVTVRIYSIDLETYFRKMHLAGGVESLDISLIDPDQSFEFKVPKYAEYQQLESQIDVPLPNKAGSGAMAVTVSSKTLTATTLVLQSDLEVVVKSSRNEVFVLAQNMVTGKVWPDAKLLISNGQQVFAEGKTGADGVFKHEYPELASANDVRVFAVAGTNTASNIVGLGGVGVATGLAERGYIYTDRPAYRPGDLVHIRGLIRTVSGDNYQVNEKAEYTVAVFDPRNRLLHEAKASLSAFGSFHTHFLLPTAAVQGDYRIQVTEAAKEIASPKSYQGVFGVHEYRLEPVNISVDTERTVFYRGEEITGKINVAFYYGAPVVGAEIHYRLAGGALVIAKTDAKGQIEFKFPTREFRETQALPLVVAFPERNIAINKAFVLATRGFSIDVKTVRPVYLAGESFEATVKTTDAEGKPIAEKLTLKVFERTTVDGRVGERFVSEQAVATDKAGEGRATLKLEKGGHYTLRAEGTDRFSNPISGAAGVQLSDDKDAVRLRLLADQHTFKVGDKAKVNLHWREAPALALITYQGARILEYKLVDLKTGDNPLELPMTAKLAPNFELAVSVMTDSRPVVDAAGKVDATKPVTRLHLASSPITVNRELKVSVEVKRKNSQTGAAKPGEEVDVVVTTTDPQGRPVAAELSLAMIEQSLLEQFASTVPAINEFFGLGRREAAVRTTASITFNYRPATQAINPRLLAEEDRKAMEAEEAAKLSTMSGLVTDGSSAGRPFGLATGPAELPGGASAGPLGNGRDDNHNGALEAADAVVDAPMPAPAAEVLAMPKEEAAAQSAAEYKPADGKAFKDTEKGFAYGVNRQPGKKQSAAKSLAAGSSQSGTPAGAPGADAQVRYAQLFAFSDEAAGNSEQQAAVQFGVAINRGNAAENFSKLQSLGRRDVVTVDNRGRMKNVYFGEWKDEAANSHVANLAADGAILLPQLVVQETGYWNPSVVTDKLGKATVTFALPDRSTAWKLLAKGATTETLCGEAESALAVKKDLFGELKLPMAFTDGDEAEISASIHNQAIDKGTIKVTLRTTIGGKSDVVTKSVDVAAKGIETLAFKQSIKRALADAKAAADKSSDKPAADAAKNPGEPQLAPDDMLIELTLTADKAGGGKFEDTVRRVIPIQPYGLSVFATAGGTATGNMTAWVEAPANVADDARSLQIILGPTVEQSLLDVLFGPAPLCQIDNARYASSLDTATSDILSAYALQRLGGREKSHPIEQSLDARLRSTVSLLVAAQNDDGGWSWTGQKGTPSHRYTSARVVWALALARSGGYKVPDDGFEKACAFLSSEIAKTREDDYESKAILLHALAAAGRGDFALANRLHRNRPALSTSALLHVAIALAAMDRRAMADDLLRVVADRKLDDAQPKRIAPGAPLPWTHSESEIRALYAIALEQVTPTAPKLKEQIDWLVAHRAGHRWNPDKSTGPAMLALSAWYAKNHFKNEKYEIEIFVNDIRAKTLVVDDATGTQTIEIPEALLKKGKQRINFAVKGRGQYTYQAVLGGFVPADRLASTTKDWAVSRTYEPAPLDFDGKPVPRGFGVISSAYSAFKNPLTQLPVGRRGLVELNVSRYNIPAATADENLEYLVVTEPLPSGASVIESTIRGGFERFELSPGAITFYIGSRRYVEPIYYEMHGYLPGAYRAAPTVVRNAYRPDQIAVAKAVPLTILPLGATSADPYRLTPQELYELGKRNFDKHEYETAAKHLADLITNWNLNADIYKDTARMLLDIHLERGPASQIVKYFEIVKEKSPEQEIPFEKIVKVGAAYHDIGEYERSYLIFRATVESSFLRENSVAGFLEAQGEFLRSIDVMQRLLLEYPAESYAAAASYALAQQVYGKASEVAGDAKLREKKITRVDLIRQAHAMLENFLTMNPDDPSADQAAFSAANALLELKAFKAAIAACEAYARRYPTSDYLDSYWYTIGYSHFAQNEHQAALEMCKKVAESKRVDKGTGREVESVNKYRAIYIMGQVYHSLGKAAEAIVEYTKVKDRFVDAAQAIEYFARKEIKLPEVSTLRPGQPGEVKLSFRNVASCDVRVYRIDLMKFSLLRRSLGEITTINLSGIRPYHEATIKLGDGKDYRDREQKIELPLKEEGAYLVVCRGDDLHASGLVLVSPLEIDVQEEGPSGRVRTTVKDVTKGTYVADAHVKVIGTRNQDFVSGQTDLRGIFVADGIAGTSTVIAQIDARRYAFFRGKTELGPPPAQAPAAVNAPAPSAKPGQQGQGQVDLIEGNRILNESIIREQRDNLRQNYQRNKGGVDAKDAY
jgi:uncharacterized protein YfaS (alpha-2-macroglobulin family)/tetratricopeptide (TPR) repeat protein